MNTAPPPSSRLRELRPIRPGQLLSANPYLFLTVKDLPDKNDWIRYYERLEQTKKLIYVAND